MKSEFDWNFSEETLKEIFKRIKIRQIELINESNNSEYDIGVIDGYTQCLDMIKNDLEIRGYDYKEFMDLNK